MQKGLIPQGKLGPLSFQTNQKGESLLTEDRRERLFESRTQNPSGGVLGDAFHGMQVSEEASNDCQGSGYAHRG